ncbi:MAG: FAD-binding oxidoreductase [Bacteroidetes bacterium]|nr:FAD-binding oxidoreductase [Bacteroidota bacterium]
MKPSSTSSIKSSLEKIFAPERILTRWIDRLAYASDASCYRIIPEAIVRPISVQEIQALFKWSTFHYVPLCFRAAGTSLSGQSVTSGIIVDISRNWDAIEILDDGKRVRVQPGIIGGKVNQLLKKYRTKLGPDPASMNACMTGGIIANNSSGMCCGVVNNSYHTIESITYILPNGTLINTADPNANMHLEQHCPEIYDGILALRRFILDDSELTTKIRSKYKIKNTVGYAINAFLDEEKPADILGRLMIGSEGTLGFIAEAVFRTIPDNPCKSTAMLYFASIQAACNAIIPLKDAGAEALELMDRPALRSVEHLPMSPDILKTLPEGATALLVEFQAITPELLTIKMKNASAAINLFELLLPPEFTQNPKEQAIMWSIRKGMFPTAGAMRAAGTALLNEDVAFPIERLADAVEDLHILFKKYNFEDAFVFGHAKDGNLHFVAAHSFNTPADTLHFGSFVSDLAELVIGKYNGSLKAEHGTGRHITPFVEKEWGETAYSIMKQLKLLVDKNTILNPDVMISTDINNHTKNLKSLPIVHSLVDKCIECGFCESKCPSKNLTITPRQRIVLWREMKRLPAEHQTVALMELQEDFLYSGIETCAIDGMCSTVCPVGINTGELVKLTKNRILSESDKRKAIRISKYFPLGLRIAQLGLQSAQVSRKLLGNNRTKRISQFIMSLFRQKISWQPFMGQPPKLPQTTSNGAEAVYFPTCTSRLFGQSDSDNLPATLVSIAQTAGVSVFIPNDSISCCGLAFSSKGFAESGLAMWTSLITSFWEWSNHGKLPIVIDASSCSLFLKTPPDELSTELLEIWKQLKIMDSIEFVYDIVLPKLSISPINESIVLHPNCSLIKMGLTDKMEAIAQKCANHVTIPDELHCCGFAGDKGLLHPELTASATEKEATEINQHEFDGYYSSNITCEMGMSSATGQQYRSLLFVVEKAIKMNNSTTK